MAHLVGSFLQFQFKSLATRLDRLDISEHDMDEWLEGLY